MIATFGEKRMTAPTNMARPVHFPSMATMDKATGDGRKLLSEGKGVRNLPRTIYAQFSQEPGHSGSVPVGALHAVSFHDDGNVEGWGWLLDDENGAKMAYYLESEALRHNSVDLADVEVDIEWIYDDDGFITDYNILFAQWNIAATTFVGTPAFADAYGELSDELTAALLTNPEPLEVNCPTVYTIVEPELTAAAETAVAWADFHIPEADTPHKIIIDDQGRVYGHLALWDDPGPRKPPRPVDNYASFNQPSVLSEQGMVETGPIFFEGGHPDNPLGRGDVYKAYGGVENAWGDVRVIPGLHGPWLSGRVRPGVSDEVIYAARASRISGHWVGNELRAIVSVNVPRFNIAGSGRLAVTGVSHFKVDDKGELLELVASMPPGAEASAEVVETVVEETVEVELDTDSDAFREAVAAAVDARLAEIEAERAAALAEAESLALELELADT